MASIRFRHVRFAARDTGLDVEDAGHRPQIVGNRTRAAGVFLRDEQEGRAAVTVDDYDLFYSSTYRPLVTQLYALTGAPAHAEEIAQEAFVRAWLAWDRIAAYDDPRAWVRRVAFRIAVSRWRTAGRLARALVKHGPPEAVSGPGPLAVAVATALRAVPMPQRRALVLHYLCGLSVAEIAREEGVPEGTVKSRLSRGRDGMAELLGDEPIHTATRGRR